MPQTNIFQIFYNQKTMGMLDKGFLPMNNSENLRPEWREYWSIRHYLLSQKIDLDSYYGFFSPKFYEKTNLNSADVFEFMKKQTDDVVSFSPYFDQIAFFINPFIQGEINHPGLINTSQKFFNHIKTNINISTFVSDQYTSIYSNFFVAKGKFWIVWLDYCEKLFHICEEGTHPLAKELNRLVSYKAGEDVAMKIFIIERMVTVILKAEKFTSNCINNLVLPYAGNFLLPHHKRMVHCEALKQAYLRTGNTTYLDFFNEQAHEIGDSVKRHIELLDSTK
jgi:hypothetical protein